MQSEIGDSDPEVMERFMAEHGGMTPFVYALVANPSALLTLERNGPERITHALRQALRIIKREA